MNKQLSLLPIRQVSNYALKFAVHLLLMSINTVMAHDEDPLVGRLMDWKVDNVSRTLSLAHYDHIGFVEGLGSYARVEHRDGRRCLRGAVFAFDVSDAYAFDIDEAITLELEFDRQDTDGFIVAYDRNAVPFPMLRQYFANEGSRWVTARLVLERARFANRGYNGSDLVLAALGTELFDFGKRNIELTLCDLKITYAPHRVAGKGARTRTGRINLAVFDDASGDVVPARIGIYDHTGRSPLPSEDAVTIQRYLWDHKEIPMRPGQEPWPKDSRYVFYAKGNYAADIPPGIYDLVVARGPEYRFAQRQVEIRAGETAKIDVRLKRWAHLAENGWFSGDQHVHMHRTKPENSRIGSLMQAEDLNVSSLLQMANIDRFFFGQYAFGERGRYIDREYALISGQESPRTGYRGHMIGLNLERYHDPSPYYAYHTVAEQIHSEGGLVGYAHVAFDIMRTREALALEVPLGLVDFAEILQFGTLNTEIIYDLWNMGFKITPTAGSDFPYVNLPGTERNYVHVSGPFSLDNYFDGLKEGHTFVTNGPILDLTVNGMGMGQEIRVAKGSTVKVEAVARMNPDYGKVEVLEVVVHGQVEAEARSEKGAEELRLRHDLMADRGIWIAIRASGGNGRVAHSAPVYVYTGTERSFWKTAGLEELLERQKRMIGVLVETGPSISEELEFSIPIDHYRELMLEEWRKSRDGLRELAVRATQKYDDMLKELRATRH